MSEAAGSPAPRGRARRVTLLVCAAVLALGGFLLVGWAALHQVSAPSVALAGEDPGDVDGSAGPTPSGPGPAGPGPTGLGTTRPTPGGTPAARLVVEPRPVAAPGFRPGPLLGGGPGSVSVRLVTPRTAPTPPTPLARPTAPAASLPASPAASLPASPPVVLRVPAIGVDAPVGSVGLNPDRTMEVPAPGPTWDMPAWYRYSVTPGQRGPSVIVGHVDSHVTGPSVFFDLARLRAGEVVEVARADGSVARFAVTRVERFAKTAFPTDAVYAGTTGPELRLITCGGSFDPAVRSYRDNTVVFAVGVPPL